MESKIICPHRKFSDWKFWLGFCLSILIVTFPQSRTQAQESKPVLIRIAVFQDLKEFKLSIKGEFQIAELSTGRVLFTAKNLNESIVKDLPDGIQIGSQKYSENKIAITSFYEAVIYINRQRFRGAINLIHTPDKKLLVVNVVDLEDYVKGVLYHEVSHRWPIEALKAQAVAARTYALYRMKSSKDKDFDLTNDIYSQVYGGKNSERYRSNLAVEGTRKKILTFQGKILPAYFHAACAGHTEDVSELWKEDLLPLKGVKCPFCVNSPHYRWKKNFRSKDVQDKLNKNGYPIGLIQDIRVQERNPGGRVRLLKITARDGQTVLISGKDFRNIVGPNDIRSNNYEVIMVGYYFDLLGYGWGHGVGLCQWGAFEMARQRYKYDDILGFYYPAVKIQSLSQIKE